MSASFCPAVLRQQDIDAEAERFVAQLVAAASAVRSDSPRMVRVVSTTNGLQSLLAAAVRASGLSPEEAVRAVEHLTAWVLAAHEPSVRSTLSWQMRRNSLAAAPDYERPAPAGDFATQGNA